MHVEDGRWKMAEQGGSRYPTFLVQTEVCPFIVHLFEKSSVDQLVVYRKKPVILLLTSSRTYIMSSSTTPRLYFCVWIEGLVNTEDEYLCLFMYIVCCRYEIPNPLIHISWFGRVGATGLSFLIRAGLGLGG